MSIIVLLMKWSQYDVYVDYYPQKKNPRENSYRI